MAKTKSPIDQRGQHITFQQAVKDFFNGATQLRGYTSRRGFFYPIFFLLGTGVCCYFSIPYLLVFLMVSFGPTSYTLIPMIFGVCSLLLIVLNIAFFCSAIRRWRDIGLTVKSFFALWGSTTLLRIMVLVPLQLHHIFSTNPVKTIVGSFANDLFIGALLLITCLPSGSCLTEKPNHFFCRNKHQEPAYTHKETE